MRIPIGRILVVCSSILWLTVLAAGCSSGGETETDAGRDADAGDQNDAGQDGADEIADDGGQEGDGDQQVTDSETGTVEGVVILAGSGDHAGTLAVIDSLPDRQAVTDALGAYRIEQVPPGSYSLTATHTDYEQRSTVPFQVVAGMVTTAPTLTLQPLTGSMTGYVYLENATDHAGSVVGVQGTIHATTTNQDGQWSIQDVEAGNYTVVASHPGYLNNTATDQQVSGGELTTVPPITLIEKGDLGEDCVDESTCDSNWCVDGVCCENECAGFCQTCGGDIDASHEVEVDEEGFKGACTYFEPGADLEGECPDDQECTPGCDGSGACNFTCVQQGEDCSSDEVCVTGNCVNDVCCLVEQCGQCRRCDISDYEGECHLVPAGSESEGACTDSGGCGTNGLCDAEGACQYYASGTVCDDDNSCTGDGLCDGGGACLEGDPEINFFLCESNDALGLEWDICVEGQCLVPGACSDASCNSPGPHFVIRSDTGSDDFERIEGEEPLVRDLATGLMWQGCQKGQSGDQCAGTTEKLGFSDALDYCNGLIWAGLDDWHLPDEYELMSILDYGRSANLLDPAYFAGTGCADTWTSTALGGDSTHYLVVHAESGVLEDQARDNDIVTSVRCVRQEVPIAGTYVERFSRTGGTEPLVADNVTHLIWQGCAAGAGGDACLDSPASEMTWNQAILYCQDLDWGGYDTGWRLPGLKELYSIVDTRVAEAVDIGMFRNPSPDWYWTGVEYAGDSGWAWRINLNNVGLNLEVNAGDKDSSEYSSKVLCVHPGT